MIKLSNRLLSAAKMVTEGNILADVGTDHGYVPIYLCEQKKIPHAIAMDINEGPLERAKEHIKLYEMGEYIETRLSDGVAALKAGEADSILIAGMGGGLMMHILKDGKDVCRQAKELILQPQSELQRFREFLLEEGYEIVSEDMVLEEEKYYPMMKVRYAGAGRAAKETDRLASIYGGLLLKQKHPVLKTYLLWEQALYRKIYGQLKKSRPTEKILQRIGEVEQTLKDNEAALQFFD